MAYLKSRSQRETEHLEHVSSPGGDEKLEAGILQKFVLQQWQLTICWTVDKWTRYLNKTQCI